MAQPSELPIVAALEEAEAITANVTDAISYELAAIVGEGPLPAATILGDCNIRVPPDASYADVVLASVTNRICAVLSSAHQTTADGIAILLTNTSAGINRVLDAIEDQQAAITTSIVGVISNVVTTVTARLDSALRSIGDALEATINGVGNYLGGVVAGIERGISDVLGFLSNAVTSIFHRVGDAFTALLDVAEAVFDIVADKVGIVVTAIISVAEATYNALSETLASVLAPLIAEGESVLGRLGDLVASVPAALVESATKLLTGLGESIGKPLGSLGTILVAQVEDFFSRLISEGQLSHGQVLRTLLTRLGAPADVVQKIASAADDSAPETPAFFLAALAFLVPLIVAQFVGSALEPVAEQMRQEISKQTRQTLLTPADLVDGFIKGDVTPQRFQSDFEQAGYTQERMDLMVSIAKHPPDISTAMAGWLRGLVSDDNLDAILTANRLRPEDARLLKQVVFFVPPASDLIRMAVRDTFNPEVRERFGLDEDYPEDFSKFAAQQGISDEWARSYWAAHWALPSATQGFEMLHRHVIDPADLDMLLKALDVMPFWRDKLTAIAYSPMTRVDLRRMHAMGLLTDKELQVRYEALGFNEDDAAMMVAFTVAYNAADDTLPEELEGLTRASVLNMFEDGIIKRGDAVKLLIQMGQGEDAAELYVQQRELHVEREDRKDLIESVVELAGGGHISLPDSQDRLAQLGITATEAARAIARIAAKIRDPGRIPSLESLDKMLLRGIIDEATYKEALETSGFSGEWINRQFALATPGAKT